MQKFRLGLLNNLLFASLLISAASCESQPKLMQTPAEQLSRKIGPWENIYKGDPDLAGVSISQYPESAPSRKAYENMHPGLIFYFFWDGRVRQILHKPDGDIAEDFWWKDIASSGDGWWNAVDFSYGSDPNFEKNRDPRLANN